MTIKELSTVFFGSVKIQRATFLSHHRIRFDELYDGQLMKLTDENILNCTINVITNIPGSTLRNGVPYLNITVK